MFYTISLYNNLDFEVFPEIDSSLLEFYTYKNKWEAEVGKFYAFIGTNSDVSDFKEFHLVK